MSSKRTRHRRPPPAPTTDSRQDEVDDLAEELAVLWPLLPSALARDSAGLLKDDRHATGASSGSAATVNLNVVEAIALIEVGLYDRAAEAARLLNIAQPRGAAAIIAGLANWHRNLLNRGQPLAGYLRRDLESWVSMARSAIGTRLRDELLGMDCPDHRDTARVRLRVLGATARIADSLLQGPPSDGRRLLAGPLCAQAWLEECRHDSCEWISTRRLVNPYGSPTDWCLTSKGVAMWSSVSGELAFTWERTKTIRCPKCKRQWTTTTERRLLARELADLGDTNPGDAAMLT